MTERAEYVDNTTCRDCAYFRRESNGDTTTYACARGFFDFEIGLNTVEGKTPGQGSPRGQMPCRGNTFRVKDF